MPLPGYEGIVENGQIRLRDNVTLPENARVFVLLSEDTAPTIRSPQLVNPEQAADFVKEVHDR